MNENSVEFLNDFEKKIIVTKLKDFDISFDDSNSCTIIVACSIKTGSLHRFHTYTLDPLGEKVKKDIESLCNGIVENDQWFEMSQRWSDGG